MEISKYHKDLLDKSICDEETKALCGIVFRICWVGPRAFAANVLKQGFCSPKQKQAMINMAQSIRTKGMFKHNHDYDGMGGLDHDDITDWTGQGSSSDFYS